MRHAWLPACICLVLGCSDTRDQMLPGETLMMSNQPEPTHKTVTGAELIPAEWTVGEDTSVSGDVTTISLQLPNAREIGGLLDDEAPRLILRCVSGKMQAFIDTEAANTEAEMPLELQPVRVELDSAPACE